MSKIKNTNVQRALNSDMADYVIEETQNQAKNKLIIFFVVSKKTEQRNK